MPDDSRRVSAGQPMSATNCEPSPLSEAHKETKKAAAFVRTPRPSPASGSFAATPRVRIGSLKIPGSLRQVAPELDLDNVARPRFGAVSRLCPVSVPLTTNNPQRSQRQYAPSDLRFRRISTPADDARQATERPVTAEAAGSSGVGVAVLIHQPVELPGARPSTGDHGQVPIEIDDMCSRRDRCRGAVGLNATAGPRRLSRVVLYCLRLSLSILGTQHLTVDGHEMPTHAGGSLLGPRGDS